MANVKRKIPCPRGTGSPDVALGDCSEQSMHICRCLQSKGAAERLSPGVTPPSHTAQPQQRGLLRRS